MGLAYDIRALVQGVPHLFIGGESKIRAGVERLASRLLGAQSTTPISIESAAFTHNGPIPAQFTSVDGDNIQPSLRFGDVPRGTRALVLIVEDPDAPMPRPFVHWIAVLSPYTRELVAGGEGERDSLRGRTSMMKTGWLGCAPPKGDVEHRYFFQLFALDKDLDVADHPGRSALLNEMKDHVIGYGELIGTYKR